MTASGNRLAVWIAVFGLVFLTSGCAATMGRPSLGPDHLSPVLDRMMEVEKIECANLAGKKVFTRFVSEQQSPECREVVIFLLETVTKLEYDGRIEDDFKRKVDDLLAKQCKAVVTDDEKASDYRLIGKIKRYYSEVLDFKREGHPLENILFGSTMVIDESTVATTLKVETTINDTPPWQYDHHLKYRTYAEYARVKWFFVVASYSDTSERISMKLHYDGSHAIASGQSIHRSNLYSAWLIYFPVFNYEAGLHIHDEGTEKSKRFIAFHPADFALWTPSVTDEEKKPYYDTYFDTRGHFRLLFYDYFKKLVERFREGPQNPISPEERHAVK